MKTITINNLAESTTEEVFEYIRNHLLTQNAKSRGHEDGICYYHGDHHLKCAAGCLISDDKYTPKFEVNNWSTLVRKGLVLAAHSELIKELQYLHDDVPVDSWKHHLDLLRKDIEEGRFNESIKSF